MPADRLIFKVAGLKQMFLDFTTKLESPRFVRPLRRTYDKDTILKQLETTRSSLRQAILTLDLDKLCTTVEEPALADSTEASCCTLCCTTPCATTISLKRSITR